jgi:hypothetical protein
MAIKNLTDFNLSRDSYTAFDAKSLKELIQTRLNQGEIYTDQNFEGSNMSSIIDVIAYSYHLLLFYLNQTSAESMFTDTTIYDQSLTNFSSQNLLREGQYIEYPQVFALGEDFEKVILSVRSEDDNIDINIDSQSIDLYVQDVDTKVITEFKETNNLFLEGPDSNVYEKRLNENGLYEFKFGNGIFGKKINAGDSILIYYIQSSGDTGVVSPGVLNGNKLNLYNTPQFNQISNNIFDTTFNFITIDQIQNLNFSNSLQSTNPVEKEDIESIRNNASKNFQLQNRIVTLQDYNNFLQTNFSQILKSFSVVNNNEYVNSYLNYFLNIGLNKPNDDSRVLFNQVNFNSINQANNIYLFLVSKFNNVDQNDNLNYVSTSQKTSIINMFREQQQANINIVPVDPVYTSFSLGVRSAETEKLTTEIKDESFLVIKRNILSNSSIQAIKERINNIFINYFNDLNLGDLVSLKELSNQIFNIGGIEDIKTRRIKNNNTLSEVDGLSLLVFNPIYPDNDINILSNDLKLPFFKYPYLSGKSILSNILVENA